MRQQNCERFVAEPTPWSVGEMERLAAADARAPSDTSPADAASASSDDDDDDAGQHARWALNLTSEMDEHLISLRVEQHEAAAGSGPTVAVEEGRRHQSKQRRARRSKKAPEEPSSLMALAASDSMAGSTDGDIEIAAAQRARTNAKKLKLKSRAARGRGKAARRSQASLARKRLGMASPIVAAPPPAQWGAVLTIEAPQPRHAPPPPPSPPSSPLIQIAARGPPPLLPPSLLPLHRLEVAREAAAAAASPLTMAQLKLRACKLRRQCADEALPEEARALHRKKLAACKRAMRRRVAERAGLSRGAAAMSSAPAAAPLVARTVAPPSLLLSPGLSPVVIPALIPALGAPLSTLAATPDPAAGGAAAMRAAMRAQQLREARAHRERCEAALAEFGATLREYTASAPRSGSAPPLATVAKRTVQRKRAVRILSQVS